MAAKHKLLVLLCSSLLLSVRGQCSIGSFYLLKNEKVISKSQDAVKLPLIEQGSSEWTCLYIVSSGNCDSVSNHLTWGAGLSGVKSCARLDLDGHTSCMQTVKLITNPHQHEYYCSSPSGDSLQVTFSDDQHDYHVCSDLPISGGETCLPTTTQSTSSKRTQPTSSQPAQFSGINPLIYTITAVALLGTASIIAMISCCIRQRRSMLRRREFLFGREYLDFMNEQDFTQLTASQLAASLQEAPPTYQQSQEIEEQLKDAQEDEDTPPPLPPRNAPRPLLTPGDLVTVDNEEDDDDGSDTDMHNLI